MPVQALQVLRLWTRREIVSRYAGSAGGMLWALLHPLLNIVLFYFVFAVVLKVRVPELRLENGYFFYLLAGLLPWLGLSEGLVRASQSLVAHEQLLQKVVFPVFVLPVSAILASLVPQLIGMGILMALLALHSALDWAGLLWLPLLLLCQLILTAGLGLFLAALSVVFRDLVQLVPVLVQFLFYATPILYPRSMVPEKYQHWFLANPFALLMDGYHAAFLGLPWPGAGRLGLLLWSLALGTLGLLLFRRLRALLGDWL